MGRTKKRHRAWKQQMRSRARKRRDGGFSWGDISPGRLVAWAEWIPIVRPRNREGADARRKIIAEPKEIAVEEGRTND